MFFIAIMKKKKKKSQNWTSEFKRVIYRRYANDTYFFALVEKFRDYLNRRYKNIRLTP